MFDSSKTIFSIKHKRNELNKNLHANKVCDNKIRPRNILCLRSKTEKNGDSVKESYCIFI